MKSSVVHFTGWTSANDCRIFSLQFPTKRWPVTMSAGHGKTILLDVPHDDWWQPQLSKQSVLLVVKIIITITADINEMDVYFRRRSWLMPSFSNTDLTASSTLCTVVSDGWHNSASITKSRWLWPLVCSGFVSVRPVLGSRPWLEFDWL